MDEGSFETTFVAIGLMFKSLERSPLFDLNFDLTPSFDAVPTYLTLKLKIHDKYLLCEARTLDEESFD